MLDYSTIRKYKKLQENKELGMVHTIAFLISRLKTRGGYTSIPPKVLKTHNIEEDILHSLSPYVIYWCKLDNLEVTFDTESNTFHF
jgi:hypothetical protein